MRGYRIILLIKGVSGETKHISVRSIVIDFGFWKCLNLDLDLFIEQLVYGNLSLLFDAATMLGSQLR